MLCPKCGIEVGEELKLCPRCTPDYVSQAQRASGSLTRDQLEEDDDTSDVSRPAAPSRPPGSRFIIRYVVPCLAGLATSIALVFTYSMLTSRASAVTRNSHRTIASVGKVHSAASSFDAYPVALLLPAKRRIELAYFRSIPAELTQEALSLRQTMIDVEPRRPEVVLGIQLKENGPCEPAGVESVDLSFTKSPGAMPLRDAVLTFNDAELVKGLVTLSCDLKNHGAIVARYLGSPMVPFSTMSASVNVDLQIRGALLEGLAADSVDYRSSTAKETIALWDAKKSELSFGFFADPVSVKESETMRQERSLLAVDQKLPSVVLSLTIPGRPSQLAADKISGYTITFYRGSAGDIVFPGAESSVTFSYAGASTEQVKQFQGALGEGRPIGGRFEGSAAKDIEGHQFKFSWKLAVSTALLDLDEKPLDMMMDVGTSVTGRVAAPQPSAQPPPLPIPGAAGTVSSDGEATEIRTVVPVFYEDTSDLAIGFYPQELSDDEVREIQKRRSLHTAIKHKRASMVVILDFAVGTTAVSRTSLNGYTIYFYRDSEGHFTFPGAQDAVSLKRLQEQFRPDEVIELSGSLKKGSKVTAKLKGDGSSDRSPARFSWDLTATVAID